MWWLLLFSDSYEFRRSLRLVPYGVLYFFLAVTVFASVLCLAWESRREPPVNLDEWRSSERPEPYHPGPT